MTDAAAVPAQESGLLDILARRPLAILFLLCLIAWVPGFFTLSPLDRDESRFAQASKQMIETGNYVDIRYSVGPRYKKPVGIYWMQAASTLALSKPPYNEIWTYRLPSLIGGFIAVFLAYWCARAFAPPPTALIAAALIGFTVSLTAETKIAKTDAVLLATVLGSQALLMRAYLADRLSKTPPGLWLAMGGWLAFAIGVMIKGPIILAVLAVTVVAVSLWDRDWKWLKTIHPIPGIILTLVICLPWGIAIALISHGDFYKQALGHDLAAKIMGGQESHGAPPGYYLALASVTLWPATLFALPGIGNGIANRADPALRYLLAWGGAAWAMFELVPTKLPHYILPAYPAVAFLGALWAMRATTEVEHRWQRVLRYLAAAQFFLGVTAFTVIPIVAPLFFGNGINFWLVAGAALGFLPGVAAVLFLLRRETMYAALCAVAAAVIFYPLIIWGMAPRVPQIWMSPRAAAMVAHDRLPGDPPVILGGYVEPSLVFLLGTDTEIQSGKGAAEVAARTGGLALIEDHEQAKFLTRLKQLHATARAVDGFSGFNYSRGRREHITAYRVTKAP
ncbi:MAG TPA: glycosyltransferase family 39 protein [Rhizomicrobium sp.]|jgi:4-amino-4-deoxy-L-arabinose transferase-like glycosyltransferase|nr:glycosyltransferase family 39 protein [Rhizomicrobium sp.]